MCPAEVISIDVEYRHNIEIQMIQHSFHGCVSLIGQNGLKDKGDIFLKDGYQKVSLRRKHVLEILTAQRKTIHAGLKGNKLTCTVLYSSLGMRLLVTTITGHDTNIDSFLPTIIITLDYCLLAESIKSKRIAS